MQIKKIHYKETYPLRHIVLRKGQPFSSCAMAHDELASTLHYGFFQDNQLIGVGSCMDESNEKFPSSKRIRGLAVIGSFRGLGIGSKLLAAIEKDIKNEKKDWAWMNSRASAIKFYLERGYRIEGDSFEIAQIGKHYICVKYLK